MITSEEEVVLLRKQLEDLEQALIELTPGGSEFHGSPQRCIDWANDRVSMTMKLAGRRNRYRKVGEQMAEVLSYFTEDSLFSGEVKVVLEHWNEVTGNDTKNEILD